MMKLFFIALTLIPTLSLADRGYVKVSAGHEVYVDYVPAQSGRPTVVLLNGLVYETDRWDGFARKLQENGIGVLRYYFRGQFLTLRREVEQNKQPKFFQAGLERQDFSLELKDLLDHFRIQKAVVVGLSFGAGIASDFSERFPSRVDQLFLMAPLVVSLDRYDPNGAWLHWNLDALRAFWGPLWGPYVYDQYYNWIFRSYMRQRLVPERIPESLRDLSEAYKESMFHLVRSIRDFNLKKVKFNLNGKVNVFVASQEDEPALRDQFSAWNTLGKARGTFAYLSPAFHAIPDSSGAYAADLVVAVLKGTYGTGRSFYAPVSKRGSIELKEYSHAELEEKAMAERRE